MTSAIDAGIKWRPKPSEVAELGPEFQEYWDSYFANAPDKPVLYFGISSMWVLGYLVVKMFIIYVVQVPWGSYRGPTTQILHLVSIYCGPTQSLCL